MNAETYTVVSFEELEQAKKDRDMVIAEYGLKHKNYLLTCLSESGLDNARVRVKKTGVNGRLIVKENHGSLLYPYEIKFYPIKKDGSVSLIPKFVPNFYGWSSKTMRKMLNEVFEIEEGTKI